MRIQPATPFLDFAKARAAERQRDELPAVAVDRWESVGRDQLESLHGQLQPQTKDFPNLQAAWVMGLGNPILGAVLRGEQERMKSYDFASSLTAVGGAKAREIRQAASLRQESLRHSAERCQSLASVGSMVGWAGAFCAIGGCLLDGMSNPVTLTGAAATVAGITTNALAHRAREGKLEQAHHLGMMSGQIKTYAELTARLEASTLAR